MRYYELLYIVNPNLEDERVKGIIEEIGNEIGKYKVNIINHHIWGKKRLAYPVKNNKYGIYILLQFAAEQFDFLKELERFLILSKTVIRHQIIRLDEEPKKVEKIEFDDENTDEIDEDIETIEDDTVEDIESDDEVERDAEAEDTEKTAEKDKPVEETLEDESTEDTDKTEKKEEDK